MMVRAKIIVPQTPTRDSHMSREDIHPDDFGRWAVSFLKSGGIITDVYLIGD